MNAIAPRVVEVKEHMICDRADLVFIEEIHNAFKSWRGEALERITVRTSSTGPMGRGKFSISYFAIVSSLSASLAGVG